MWFTETPWPPIFICLGLAGLCFAAWNATRRGIALVGGVGLVALCAAIFAVEKLIVTDGERVEGAVLQVTSAYHERDLGRTLEFVSSDAPEIQALVQSTMERYEVRDLRITDVSARLTEAGSEAVSHFRANATIASRGGGFGPAHYATRWEMTWRREGDAWRIIRVQPLHVVSGDPDERIERHLGLER